LLLLFTIEYYETPPWVKISPGYWVVCKCSYKLFKVFMEKSDAKVLKLL
jgi:hypothetical protein